MILVDNKDHQHLCYDQTWPAIVPTWSSQNIVPITFEYFRRNLQDRCSAVTTHGRHLHVQVTQPVTSCHTRSRHVTSSTFNLTTGILTTSFNQIIWFPPLDCRPRRYRHPETGPPPSTPSLQLDRDDTISSLSFSSLLLSD